MIKKYRKWAKMKSIIEKFRRPRHFTPGDIIWTYIGTNIGHEICGHGEGITRPVLVLKRFGTIHTVLPMTSSGLFKDESGRWVLKPYHHKITSVTFGKYNKILGKMMPYTSCVVYSRPSSLDSKRFKQVPKDINGECAKISAEELLEIKAKVVNELIDYLILNPILSHGVAVMVNGMGTFSGLSLGSILLYFLQILT